MANRGGCITFDKNRNCYKAYLRHNLEQYTKRSKDLEEVEEWLANKIEELNEKEQRTS